MQEGQRITVRNRLVAAQQRNAEQQGASNFDGTGDNKGNGDGQDPSVSTACTAEVHPLHRADDEHIEADNHPVSTQSNTAAAAAAKPTVPAVHNEPLPDPPTHHEEQHADDALETASRHSSSSCRTDTQPSRRVDPTVRVTMSVLPAVEEGGPPVVSVTVQEAQRLPRAPNKPQLADMARRMGRQVAPLHQEAPTEAGDLGEWEVVAGQQSRGDSHGRWLLMHAGRQKVVWDEAVDLKQEGVYVLLKHNCVSVVYYCVSVVLQCRAGATLGHSIFFHALNAYLSLCILLCLGFFSS